MIKMTSKWHSHCTVKQLGVCPYACVCVCECVCVYVCMYVCVSDDKRLQYQAARIHSICHHCSTLSTYLFPFSKEVRKSKLFPCILGNPSLYTFRCQITDAINKSSKISFCKLMIMLVRHNALLISHFSGQLTACKLSADDFAVESKVLYKIISV